VRVLRAGSIAIALALGPVLASGCGHPLGVPRSGHTATPLPDGGVLVVGGSNSYPGIDRVGRYQPKRGRGPKRGRWRAAAALPVGLEGHTATALLDGRVLVVGGYGPDVEYRTEALVYDPRIDRWRAVAPMAQARSYHVATRLADGRVLVLGDYEQVTSPEIYDPRRDAWMTADSPPATLEHATLTVMRDGRVLAVGCDATLVYDPREDRWRHTGPLSSPRGQHTATLLPDGRVLVVGGRAYADGYLTDEVLDGSEIYEPRRDQWMPGPRLEQGRSNHTATLVGSVLVIAGGSPSGWGSEKPLRTAELLELSRGRWHTRAIGRRRTEHTATALSDGRLLLVGGRTEMIVNKWNLRWSRTLRLRGELGHAARREAMGAHGSRAP
jgi:hypothetical protein